MAIGWDQFGRGAAAGGMMLLALAGCADTGGPGSGAETVALAPIADPVVAFAAVASPGAEDSIVLGDTGQTARVRLVRSYAAASGRECREVLVRTGGGGTTRLLCRAGVGWLEARPLLRGGTGRP